LVLFCLAWSSCSKLSQQSVQAPNQENIFELLNGIRDKTDVEDFGILEYELYDVPGSVSSDFQAFIRSYTQIFEEYMFDQSSKYWIEDNTELSTNVKTLMTNHKRNLSTTQILNPDGSTSFYFNCLNSNGKYETYIIHAYKKGMSYTPKTTENSVIHNFAEAYIRRGWTYYWKEDYDRAIADFTEVIRLDPKNTEAYSTRGWAHYFKEDYDQAITDFTEVIRLDPKNVEAYIRRGQAYYLKEDYEQAIADYTKTIRLYPKFAEAYIRRGWVYHLKEDYNRAITNYTEVIRLNPKSAEAYIWRGRAYYWKENYDQAIADCTEAIRLDPNDAWAYSSRADSYYNRNNRGDLDRAVADYEAALRIDPDDTFIRQNLEDTRRELQLDR
jgi:tetratricopeptide (TPR) repeat protein